MGIIEEEEGCINEGFTPDDGSNNRAVVVFTLISSDQNCTTTFPDRRDRKLYTLDLVRDT